MIHVKRSGVVKFLAEVFINNPTGLITPNKLIEQLWDFPDVGKCAYNWPGSNKAPTMEYANITVLQLIASGFIRLEIDTDKKILLLKCEEITSELFRWLYLG